MGDKINKRVGLTACLLAHSVALFGLAFSTIIWTVFFLPITLNLRLDCAARLAGEWIWGFWGL